MDQVCEHQFTAVSVPGSVTPSQMESILEDRPSFAYNETLKLLSPLVKGSIVVFCVKCGKKAES